MSTFLTPNRHGYSVRFSPFDANRLVVATSQYYGLAGGGTLFILKLQPNGGLIETKKLQWTDGLFDVVSFVEIYLKKIRHIMYELSRHGQKKMQIV